MPISSATTGRFDDDLLTEFMTNFFGYGDLSGPLWFVGMEESGGGFEEIERRLATWKRRGARSTEDAAEYHIDLGLDVNFRDKKPIIQRTWRGLILIALTMFRRPTDKEAVRQYQRAEWGRKNGPVALLELLPLPSPSLDHWIYGDHSDLSHLASRKEYQRALLGPRIDGLRRLIEEKRPRAVVFYGSKYQPHWDAIAGGEMQVIPQPAIRSVERHGVTYLSIPHPVAHGLSDQYFGSIGRLLAGHVAQ